MFSYFKFFFTLYFRAFSAWDFDRQGRCNLSNSSGTARGTYDRNQVIWRWFRSLPSSSCLGKRCIVCLQLRLQGPLNQASYDSCRTLRFQPCNRRWYFWCALLHFEWELCGSRQIQWTLVRSVFVSDLWNIPRQTLRHVGGDDVRWDYWAPKRSWFN